MNRTLSLSALLVTLLFVGCSGAPLPPPPVQQPSAPSPAGSALSSSASSSVARSSDATPLGMTQTELRTELSAGTSFKDILKSRGVKVPASATTKK